ADLEPIGAIEPVDETSDLDHPVRDWAPVAIVGSENGSELLTAETESDETSAPRVTEPSPAPAIAAEVPMPPATNGTGYKPGFTLGDLHEGIEVVRQMDPPGVGCRDLRECLLYQLRFHQRQHSEHANG